MLHHGVLSEAKNKEKNCQLVFAIKEEEPKVSNHFGQRLAPLRRLQVAVHEPGIWDCLILSLLR